MPTLYSRDPITKAMVPVLGSMTQAEGDARYLKKTGGTMGSSLFVPPTPASATALASRQYALDRRVPAGVICWWPGTALPSGWVWCNGTLLLRSEYPDLFAAIGISYGFGDGITTFATPNLVGRAVCGQDTGNADYATLGSIPGAKDVALNSSHSPNQSGSYTMHNAGNSTMLYGSDGSWPAHSGTVDYRTGYQNPNNPSHGYGHFNFGYGAAAHSNVQPTIVLNGIVKA